MPRCDCGDSECPFCGTAQGTRDAEAWIKYYGIENPRIKDEDALRLLGCPNPVGFWRSLTEEGRRKVMAVTDMTWPRRLTRR